MRLFALLSALIFSISSYSQIVNEIQGPIEYVYDSSKECDLKAYVFMPVGTSPDAAYPAVAIFHGGGWSIGEPSWAFSVAKKYAGKGLVALAFQYRLSDQKDISPLDAMEDARNAIIWMRENSAELHINKEKVAAYGWSAGAHLAACAEIWK